MKLRSELERNKWKYNIDRSTEDQYDPSCRPIVLDEGNIVGKGTHEELLNTCPVYQQIAKSQLSEDDLKVPSKKQKEIIAMPTIIIEEEVRWVDQAENGTRRESQKI